MNPGVPARTGANETTTETTATERNGRVRTLLSVRQDEEQHADHTHCGGDCGRPAASVVGEPSGQDAEYQNYKRPEVEQGPGGVTALLSYGVLRHLGPTGFWCPEGGVVRPTPPSS